MDRRGEEKGGLCPVPKRCRLHAKVRVSWNVLSPGWVDFAVAGQSVLCEGFSESMGMGSTK